MAKLRIIGVRHHSPACARLVLAAIAECAPHTILIEGPADLNPRLAELMLPHTLPIAVYSYRRTAHGATASWAPFCEYSPEWVALQTGTSQGARVRFMDLPAWHQAFSEVSNRYADELQHVGAALVEFATAQGFDSTDALWDHLFEATDDVSALEADLATYFAAYRGELAASPSDTLREAYMAKWIEWAMTTAPAAATVLVVCGGFHKPALEAMARQGQKRREEPAVPDAGAATAADADADADADAATVTATAAAADADAATVTATAADADADAATVTAAAAAAAAVTDADADADAAPACGSYLVPFSFRRLDAFSGYASGMPSPAYYQAVWQAGDAAAEGMLGTVVERLRHKGQRVSTADVIASNRTALALAALRGHRVPLRCDILDGLTSSLLKDAMRRPPPWSQRGPLPPGTDPYLVEMVAAFCGELVGKLAPATPRPPLCHDVATQLAAVDLAWQPDGDVKPRDVTVNVLAPDDTAKRQVLYRLQWLGISGVRLERHADLRRGAVNPVEAWSLRWDHATEVSIIEAGSLGATLHDAAHAAIDEAIGKATSAAAIVAIMRDALLAGYETLASQLAERARTAIAQEAILGAAGAALRDLLSLAATASAHTTTTLAAFSELARAIMERALWLLEAQAGATRPFHRDDVDAVLAMRMAFDVPALADAPTTMLPSAVLATWQRCLGNADAPPALKGACLGALWSLPAAPTLGVAIDEAFAATALLAVPNAVVGDWLAGLFATARQEFVTSELLQVVDGRIANLGAADFLILLPALRRAFSYFPPSEKRLLAKRLAGGTAPASAVLDAAPDPATYQRAQQWFVAKVARAQQYSVWSEP